MERDRRLRYPINGFNPFPDIGQDLLHQLLGGKAVLLILAIENDICRVVDTECPDSAKDMDRCGDQIQSGNPYLGLRPLSDEKDAR